MNPFQHPVFRSGKIFTALLTLFFPVFVFAQLNVTISGVSPTCNGWTNGSVTATPTGGVAPYTFLWNNGFSSPSLTSIGAGSYSVTVTDANGDQASDSFTLTEPSAVTVSASVDNLCSGNGNATAVAAGGAGGYTYAWDNGATGANVTGLAPGFHCLTVTDASGCQAVGCVNVPAGLSLELVVQGLACFNFCDASVEAVATGGTGPYTYAWSNGATGSVNENLGPGDYSVTVTDANGCTISGTTTVGNPVAITIDVTVTNPPCSGGGTGSASASVSGGTAPYSYLWSTGSTQSSISGLVPGTYGLTVTDFLGCTQATSATIVPQSNVSLNISTNPSSGCGAPSGTASLAITGGVAPFNILWSNGGTGSSISGLAPGSYSVTVTDANGCGATAQATVGGTPGIDLMITGVNAGCAANGSANAMVTPGSGTPPFTYLWNTGATTSIINNLTAGTYSVTVTDAAGCTASEQVTVTSTSNISVSTSGTNLTCFGGNNGSATATASGATGAVTYAWSNGGTSQTITGLSAGTYFVTVTDAGSGCTAMTNVFISQPTPVNVMVTGVNVGCIDPGSATAVASGGTPPYTYAWSNGATGAFINNLSAGAYMVTATDANGCTDTDFVTITQSNAIDVQVNITNPISSTNADDGAVTAQVSGGVGPYTYSWNTGATTASLSNLGPGTYTVTVTDALGCTGTDSVVLEEPGCIGDRIWEDVDRDGCQDPGEFGVGGVTVTLTGTTNAGAAVNLTTTTAINGQYLFDNLAPGTYSVKIQLPTGFALSPANACTDDFTDSDFNPNGSTNNYTIASGQCNITVDGGIYDDCLNISTPGTICCNQVLCGPGVDAAPITSTTPASGGGSPVQYMWMVSTIGGPFNTSNWNPIPGATSANYDPGFIYETTYFIRCAKAANCDDWLESNSVKVEIGTNAVAVISGDEGACVGDVITYSAPNNGPGATYSWNFGPWASPSTSTAQSVNVTWLQAGLVNVTLTVTANGCTSTDVMAVFISDSPIICGNALLIDVNNMGNAVMVAWDMEKVPGNYGFSVQRSADGENFENIAVLQQAQEDGMHHYAFADYFPKSGNAFYRLEVLKNGQHYMYSNTERVARFGKANFIVYPNPMADFITIESGDKVKSAVKLEILNLQGAAVHTEAVAEGDMHHTIDLSDLKAGTYLLRLTYNNGVTEVMKVVKN
jgi:hypothetical protein